MTRGVSRPEPVQIVVDGRTVSAYEGESLATALLAAGTTTFARDRTGRSRGPFCNMGVCYDCLVLVEQPPGSGSASVRVRSCLTTVRDGMRVRVPGAG